jgi:hypothetical protein
MEIDRKEGISEIEILDAWLASRIKDGTEEVKRLRSRLASLFESDQLAYLEDADQVYNSVKEAIKYIISAKKNWDYRTSVSHE